MDKRGIKTVVIYLLLNKPFVFNMERILGTKSMKQLPLILYFNYFCQQIEAQGTIAGASVLEKQMTKKKKHYRVNNNMLVCHLFDLETLRIKTSKQSTR